MKTVEKLKIKRYYKFLRKIYFSFKNIFILRYKISYSQCGEDIIIDYIFKALNIFKPFYLDIGAYQPISLSNTYFFYKKGGCGICIEPDPALFSKIIKKRKRDICLNIGVGVGGDRSADFYVMSKKTLNTFSREEAERYQGYGNKKIEAVIRIPLMSVNEIMEKYCKQNINYISLDVEGLEMDILKSFDFDKYRPDIFCIETLSYSENKTETKTKEIIEYMTAKRYFVYADTYINTIFVDQRAWGNRKIIK